MKMFLSDLRRGFRHAYAKAIVAIIALPLVGALSVGYWMSAFRWGADLVSWLVIISLIGTNDRLRQRIRLLVPPWPTCACGQMAVAPGTRTEIGGVSHGETPCFHCDPHGRPL